MFTCSKCLSEFSDIITDIYYMNSKIVGLVEVPDIQFRQCTQFGCGNRIIDFENAVKVENYVKAEEHKEIRKLPIGDFILLKTAIKKYNIPSKVFKYRINLFMYVYINDKCYLYIPSIEQYLLTNDGRIFLK